uniref:Uncharacterized protein n=1 Tax=uncultured gamma proteobacterium HF4000_48E10 TaxID=723583 RepID=E7C8P8_9GAMM|nr:hypothetical protein [uncultured gamma proteobacterium HF4000_48E10]
MTTPVHSRVIVVLLLNGWLGGVAPPLQAQEPPLQAQQPPLEDRRALAEEGDAGAQFRLGLAYAAGEGVLQDYVAAYMWFILAADQMTGGARDRAIEERDRVASRMTAAQVAEATRAAAARRSGRRVEVAPPRVVQVPPSDDPPQQRRPTQLAKAFVMISGMYQATTTSFTDTMIFERYAEDGHTVTDYTVGGGPVFDVMAGIRVTEYLGVGGGLTWFARSDVGDESTTSVPHRFYFNQHRTATGPAAAERRELAVHLVGFVTTPVTDRVTVTVFGGPSVFQVRQELVTEVTYADPSPYNAISFEGAVTAQQNLSTWGGNVGADVSMSFSRHVGIGGLVRFSRATLNLQSSDNDTVTVTVGGLQVGGGVRSRF